MIKKAAENTNNLKSQKYGYPLEQIEENSFDPKVGEYFREVYDFQRLVKIRENNRRLQKYNENSDRKSKHLRNPLNIGENVSVLAEKKKA